MKFSCVFKSVPASVPAPDLFRHFYLDSPYAFWLDSSRADGTYARFSFMGDHRGPYAHVIEYSVGGTLQVLGHAHVGPDEGDDVFTHLEKSLAQLQLDPPPDLPFDFCGGYVGYLGYELMAVTERVSGRASATPDAQLIFCDRFLAIDHVEQVLYVVALHQDDQAAAAAWVNAICERLTEPEVAGPRARGEVCGTDALEPYLLRDRQSYLNQIASCKEQIEAGESYEVCLTNRVRVPLERIDGSSTFDAYLRLRELSPAPYACFLQTPGATVLCSSPERFLKIDRTGTVESRPIKGTMPRDPDPEADRANSMQLSTDRRFFSENLMIVDLLRNDLSRACVPGTVEVPALMKVESYATVHQLVSTVRGRLQSSAVYCVASCFPGGSMTGAPKKRTLEIIDGVEGEPRGIYSGSIGYFSLNGTVDLNIVIRTVVFAGDRAEIGVGGAITYLSKAEDEFDEMMLKARAPFSAIAHLI